MAIIEYDVHEFCEKYDHYIRLYVNEDKSTHDEIVVGYELWKKDNKTKSLTQQVADITARHISNYMSKHLNLMFNTPSKKIKTEEIAKQVNGLRQIKFQEPEFTSIRLRHLIPLNTEVYCVYLNMYMHPDRAFSVEVFTGFVHSVSLATAYNDVDYEVTYAIANRSSKQILVNVTDTCFQGNGNFRVFKTKEERDKFLEVNNLLDIKYVKED